MKSFILLNIIICFNLFVLPPRALAQLLNVGTQLTFGGSNYDVPYKTINTSDGGFISIGRSDSNISGDKTENNRGVSDFWVIKFDNSLNVQWQKSIGGSLGETGYSIAETTNGNFLVCGGSVSGISGDKTTAGYGLDDYWLVKLSSTGVILWDKTYGGTGIDVAIEIELDSNGNIFLGGVSGSNANSVKSENSRGSNDYWIIKLDSLGNKLWDKTIGGSGVENFMDFVLHANGNIILYGISFSNISGEKSQNSFNNSSDLWIVKIDNSGNVLWDKTYGGDDIEAVGYGICYNDGYYYAICPSFSGISGVKTEASRGQTDIWVVKLDTNGNFIWDKTIGGGGFDNAIGIMINSTNQLIISSSSDSNISGEKTEDSKGLQDGWIIAIDTAGTLLWQKTIGGSQSDILVKCNEISSGNYLLTAYSNSNISGDKTDNCRGMEDYWFVELETNLSTTELNNFTNFSIFPNPADNFINLQISTFDSNQLIEIYNFIGKKIFSSAIIQNLLIDISAWPNGIYFASSNGITQKFVIVK